VRDTEPFVIMWALSGSSTHKAYPHMDAVIARVLTEIPHAHFVLVGDHACRSSRPGWENEPRVHCESGKLSIRETLALAQQCDLVIGPETGVLNAVAFESMPKVIFLSHSSEKNLTRDWVNTESLHGDVPCYPCHRLHYTDEFCPREDETRAALCAFSITPADVWVAVQRAFVGRETINRILIP
jgi:ADP-heptose:LPS heptosyltransferase